MLLVDASTWWPVYLRGTTRVNDTKGNPSNVGPIFHLTRSEGATCGSLNEKTILGAPYPKRRDGLCYMDHRMPSGRLNDRVYVGGVRRGPNLTSPRIAGD